MIDLTIGPDEGYSESIELATVISQIKRSDVYGDYLIRPFRYRDEEAVLLIDPIECICLIHPLKDKHFADVFFRAIRIHKCLKDGIPLSKWFSGEELLLQLRPEDVDRLSGRFCHDVDA